MFPGAVRLLPPRHPSRNRYATEFSHVEALRQSATLNPPKKMTSDAALQSARRVARDKKQQDTEPYKCIDACTRVMPGWDKLARVINDLAHANSHLVKNILMLNANSDQMAFTNIRQTFEHNLGRFVGYNGTSAPWRTSKGRGLAMEAVYMNLKVCRISYKLTK